MHSLQFWKKKYEHPTTEHVVPNVTVPLALDLHPHYSASFYSFATLSPLLFERALGPNIFIIITTYYW